MAVARGASFGLAGPAECAFSTKRQLGLAVIPSLAAGCPGYTETPACRRDPSPRPGWPGRRYSPSGRSGWARRGMSNRFVVGADYARIRPILRSDPAGTPNLPKNQANLPLTGQNSAEFAEI